MVAVREQLGGDAAGAAADIQHALYAVRNVAYEEIRVALLRLGNILHTDFEIVLPQAVMQIAAAEEKMKQVESGDQADFPGIYF